MYPSLFRISICLTFSFPFQNGSCSLDFQMLILLAFASSPCWNQQLSLTVDAELYIQGVDLPIAIIGPPWFHTNLRTASYRSPVGPTRLLAMISTHCLISFPSSYCSAYQLLGGYSLKPTRLPYFDISWSDPAHQMVLIQHCESSSFCLCTLFRSAFQFIQHSHVFTLFD